MNVGPDGAFVNASLGTPNPTTLGLVTTSPGVRTLDMCKREDGCTVDKIILPLNAAFTLAGTDSGSAETGKRGTKPNSATSTSAVSRFGTDAGGNITV